MLLGKVRRTVERYHLLSKGERLVVGVSGGMDSMVLLHVLHHFRQEYGLSLIVAHVNHGLRPAESEKEAELVRKESNRLGLTFEHAQFNTRDFQRAGGLSAQDAARRLRFHFFKNLLQKHDARKVALGHNADDQVETVLLRLFRGAGLKGLKGMLPIREERVIRPLLEVWRSEIESYAVEHRIPFLLDSSNLKEDYLRNRLRLELIPRIERDYQPHLKAVIERTASVLREENDYLDRKAEEAFREIVHEEEEGISFRLSEYKTLHKAIQWRLIPKIAGWIYRKEGMGEEGEGLPVRRISESLTKPGPCFQLGLPLGVHLERKYDFVFLRKGKIEPIPPFEVELATPGRTSIEEIGKEVVIEEIIKEEGWGSLTGHPNRALLDYHRLQFPLRIRNFRPGDRFRPLGLHGTQKLKEFFADHKIPRFERPKVPLLVSGEIIAWVAGYRIDERVKVTGKTRRVLRIEVVSK